MTDKLPPNLLALFAPRPPLRWVPPCDQAPEKRKTAPIDGVAAFLPSLAQYEREYEYHPTESWLEKRDRKIREKKEAAEKLVAEAPKLCTRIVSCNRLIHLLTGQQITRMRTPTSEGTHSRHASFRVSTTRPTSKIWSASLGASARLSV